jgi:pimeloyl-ACP methyl ester carboxylesterase
VRVDTPDGAQVCAEVHGPPDRDAVAPPILILDGIGCSGWAFRRIIPGLAVRRRVVLPHYRGHGCSPAPPRPWRLGMEVLADDAAAVAARLELGPALVAGFSMGFQVALELYRRHRERVAGLAAIAGPSGRVLAQFKGTELFGHALPLLLATTRMAGRVSASVWQRLVPSALSRQVGVRTATNWRRLAASDFDVYMRQLARVHPELFVAMLEHAHRHSAADVVPRVAVPTLVLAGGQDNFIPLAVMRELWFALPNARFEVFPEATHALPAEYPVQVQRRIEGLADELGAPP